MGVDFISIIHYISGKIETDMNFQDFREMFYKQIHFTANQVRAWHPGFDKNNLGRWVNKGYLI